MKKSLLSALSRTVGAALPVAGPQPLDRFLTYRFHAISRASDRESSAGYLRECGLSLSEGRCLAAIGSFEPVSLQDLALAANQDKAQASRAAASLVERRLVAKETSAVDGRGVELRLTRSGRPVFRRAMALIAARNVSIFGALSAEERTSLAGLLDRIAASLTETSVEPVLPASAADGARRAVRRQVGYASPAPNGKAF